MTNYAVQEQNQDLVSLLAAHFRLLYNPTHAMADAISMLKMFPGLRGLWTLGSQNGSFLYNDISGSGLNLTRTSNVLIEASVLGAQFAPKSFFNASTDNLSHADNAAFEYSATGVRSGQNAQGITLGMWVRPATVGSIQIGMSKWGASGNRTYSLSVDNGAGENSFFVSGDGTATVGVTNSGAPLVAGNWIFIAGRYRSEVPDTKVWMNQVTNTNATSVPSSLFNGTAEFRIGQRAEATGGFTGQASLPFFCTAAVRDSVINMYFQMTAPLFGVSI